MCNVKIGAQIKITYSFTDSKHHTSLFFPLLKAGSFLDRHQMPPTQVFLKFDKLRWNDPDIFKYATKNILYI